MASAATVEGWLAGLTRLPTASGLEDAVVAWVEDWVGRRDGVEMQADSGGNLLVTQTGAGATAKEPVLAVAHMDHPAFVLTALDDDVAAFEFRGGVTAPYFEDADVEVVSRPDGSGGRVVAYDAETQNGEIRLDDPDGARVGDIVMWKLDTTPSKEGRFAAPACDDLAGVAAALAALDRARTDPELAHFGVLLTRAEEVGLVGAIHAARNRTVPPDARIISIETSRELADARVGDGPIIRTGDRSTVFDRELTNRISQAAESAGIVHQRKLMSGGGCEATAFGVYGYRATGLCLALANWHNLDEVEAGSGEATPKSEEISLADFHGLVDLLVLAAGAVDRADTLRASLDGLYESRRHILD